MTAKISDPSRSPKGPPTALSIAGTDSGGGAGLAADLATFSALGVNGTLAVAAVTAQDTLGVHDVLAIQPPLLASQVRCVVEDLAPRAAKTGMLATRANIEEIAGLAAEGLLRVLVVDPVLVSATGHLLLEEGAVSAYTQHLLQHAALVTPNTFEAAALLGAEPGSIDSPEAMKKAAKALLDTGPQAVLVKGGHLPTDLPALDVLVTRNSGESVTLLEAPRIATFNDHGSGCTLSAAITAYLARGLPLEEAVSRAKDFTRKALAGAAEWRLGAGHGRLDHFGWSARSEDGSQDE
jgi:hydroxymethylpyrimidine/phosphomethylpyrimidine kinase